MVRSRSAKPLFAGSIPAPASIFRSVSLDNEAFFLRAGSIDSFAPRAHPLGFVYVARLPPAPFPPPPLFIGKNTPKGSQNGEVRHKAPHSPAVLTMFKGQHVYEVRPRKDRRGFDLMSDVLPFGRLWYGRRNAVSNAIGRSQDAVIRVYDEAGNVIETHDQAAISRSGGFCQGAEIF